MLHLLFFLHPSLVIVEYNPLINSAIINLIFEISFGVELGTGLRFLKCFTSAFGWTRTVLFEVMKIG